MKLPVYRDTYQLILQVFEYTKDFLKEYKYTLGQDMKRDALHLLRSIYRADKHKNRAEQSDIFLSEGPSQALDEGVFIKAITRHRKIIHKFCG